MATETAKYHVGQVIHHTLFDYRGVIIDVDAEFRIGAQLNAPEHRPRPNRETTHPWYHVLVDGTADRTYVSEQNLEPDIEGAPVDHPDVIDYFEEQTDHGYVHHPHKIN
ncbi:MAG: heat shock protein HspQ [Magnetovibrio sp.]|nr:heat shock protein HspQ [Magnetovibrio sp.]